MQTISLERSKEYPLYLQLAASLRDRIDRGEFEPNEALPSETEFSQKLKICHLTIRKALKKLQEEGYIYKIRGKGTFVSEKQNSPELDDIVDKHKVVGISVPESSEDSHSGLTCRGVVDYFHNHAYRVIRMDYINMREERIRVERNHKFMSGLILRPPLNNADAFENLKYFSRELKLPVVLSGHAFTRKTPPVDIVRSDDYNGVRDIIGKFFLRGHRRIAFITTNLPEDGFSPRMEGYQNFMNEAELEPLHINLHGIPQTRSGSQELCKILNDCFNAKQPPTAILGVNDLTAIATYNILNSMGIRMPDDVELSGFGDVISQSPYYASMNLPVSSVKIDYAKLGHEAAEVLIKRIKNPENHEPELIEIPTRFIKRGTTRE